MSTTAAIILMLALEMAALTYCSFSREPYRMGGICVCGNMLLITLYGGWLVDLGGWQTNIGNIWYASAVTAMLVTLERHGPAAVLRLVPMVYTILIFMVSAGFVLRQFPMIEGNDAAVSIAAVAGLSARIVAAAFAAFFLSVVVVLVPAWTWLRARSGPVTAFLLAAFACQIVDSPTFFIPAFWGVLEPAALLEVMAVGLVFKVSLHVALLPAFLLAVALPQIRISVQ